MVLHLLTFTLVGWSSQSPHRSLKYHIVPQIAIENGAWKINEQPQHHRRKHCQTLTLPKTKPNQHLSLKPNDFCTLSSVQRSMPRYWVHSCGLSKAGYQSKAKTKGKGKG